MQMYSEFKFSTKSNDDLIIKCYSSPVVKNFSLCSQLTIGYLFIYKYFIEVVLIIVAPSS